MYLDNSFMYNSANNYLLFLTNMAEETIQTAVPAKKGMGTGAKLAITCSCLVVLAIGAGVVLGGAGLFGATKVVNEVSKEIDKQEDRDTEAFANPKSLGVPVIVNDVQWTVTGAENLGSTIKSKYPTIVDDCVANSGNYVKVAFKIKNNSNDMVTVTDVYLYDSTKREYVTSSDVSSCVDDELFILDNINPGIENSFVAIYEVPADASGLRVKVGDLDLFTEDHEYVALGF